MKYLLLAGSLAFCLAVFALPTTTVQPAAHNQTITNYVNITNWTYVNITNYYTMTNPISLIRVQDLYISSIVTNK